MKSKGEYKQGIKKAITGMLELPSEIVFNLPLISIVGNEEMLIENYKGVIEYSDDRIRINTSCGIMKIEGKALVLKQVTSENIKVKGTITRFEYLL